MKNLLFISHGDSISPDVMRYVARLGHHYNANVQIVFIYSQQNSVLSPSSDYIKQQSEYLSMWSEMSSKLKEEIEVIIGQIIDLSKVSIRITSVSLLLQLMNNLKEKATDLIIVDRLTFNKTSNQDIKDLKSLLDEIYEIPILVVPNLRVFKESARIGFLSNMKKDEVLFLSKILHCFQDGQIEIIHCSGADSSKDRIQLKVFQDYILQEFPHHRISFRNSDFDFEFYIDLLSNDLEESDKYDVIALSTRRRSIWERILDPSKALRILHKMDKPVLLFRQSRTNI